MHPVKHIWIRQERAEAGFGAKVDSPAAVLGAREVSGVRVTEDPPAERDEAGLPLVLRRIYFHVKPGAREPFLHDCRNEDLEGIDGQSKRRFGSLQALGAGEQDLQLVALDLPGAREIQVQPVFRVVQDDKNRLFS